MDLDVCRQSAVVGGLITGIALATRGDYGSADETPSLVIPANYAFGIWAPIYAGAVAYAGYQALPSQRDDPVLRRAGWASAVGYLSSGLWALVLPQKRFWATEALLATTMASAAVAYARTVDGEATTAQRWLVRAPLGAYAGWITLATAASTTEALLLEGVGGLGLGEVPWAVLVLAAAGAVAAAVTQRVPASPAYPAAVVWGLVGTAVQQLPRSRLVGATAAAVAAGVGAVAARAHRAARST